MANFSRARYLEGVAFCTLEKDAKILNGGQNRITKVIGYCPLARTLLS